MAINILPYPVLFNAISKIGNRFVDLEIIEIKEGYRVKIEISSDKGSLLDSFYSILKDENHEWTLLKI
jgi:hypothetical protein